MVVLAEAPDIADRSTALALLRRAETEVLLSAVATLRRAGVLTEDEFQAKRRRLAAQL